MKLLRRFIKEFFICIFINDEECCVAGQICKNSNKIETIKAKFEVIENKVDFKFNEYIKHNIKKAHSAYIVLLLNSQKQWALPVCDREGYNKFGINFNEVNILPMPGSWSIFIPKDEIEKNINLLNGINIDLLYSPYVLLYEKICEFKADDKVTLYVYAQKSNFTIMVFNDLNMLFASFFNGNSSQQDSSNEEEGISPINIAEIDNIIAKEDDKFSALNALHELEVVNEELSNDFEDLTKVEDIERSAEEIEASLQKVGRCGILLNYIKDSINNYYKNSLYDSKFIEKIVIFDSDEVIDEQNFTQIVNHELFIETIIFNVNCQQDLLNIAIKELQYE